MSAPFQLAAQAHTGFSNASAYDTHRPSYPPAAVSALLRALGIEELKGARIVELGAGTGKFTEVLANSEGKFEIVAGEPHEGMRGELQGKQLAGVKVVDGDAAEMPLQDGWADACIAAQAFHWFATDKSLREIHRVLKPGAKLGMIWNIEDYNSPKEWACTTKWEEKLNSLILSLEDGLPRFRHLKWKDVFENQVDTTPLQALKDTFTQHMPTFSLPLGEQNIKWTVWLKNEEAVWDRYSTLSQIANLDTVEREKFKGQFLEILKGDDVERNDKGEILLHGLTYLAWTSRI